MKTSDKQSIKTIYYRKLLLFMILGTTLSCLLAYGVLTLLSEFRTSLRIDHKLRDIEVAITHQNEDVERLMQGIREYTLTKATAVAMILEGNPEILLIQEKLDILRGKIDIEGVRVSDKTGKIIARSLAAELIKNFKKFNDDEVEEKYLGLISDKNLVIVDDPELVPPETEEKKNEQKKPEYLFCAGMPRLDEPGIVQILYTSRRYYELLAYDSAEELVSGFSFSDNGIIAVSKNDIIISSNNKAFVGKNVSEIYNTSRDAVDFEGHFRVLIDGVLFHGQHKNFLDYTIIGLLPEAEVYEFRLYSIVLILIGNILVFSILYFVILFLLKGTIIKPIQRVNDSLQDITSGNLDVHVNVDISSEFDALSSGINKMVSSLKDTIETTKHQMERDMKLAALIQHSALPRIFPPYPEKKQFDIFALMNAAKEVGGDFYDFFMLGEDCKGAFLVMVIADVAGKGIPGALFMMSCKTLLKQLVESGIPIDQVLKRANRSICESNDTGMFVTIWIGMLDINSGELFYSNAGHNPPIILRANGDIIWLKSKPNLIVGSFPFAEYVVRTEMLHPNDKLFLYTDGVNECMDEKSRQYGNNRIEAFLSEHKDDDVTELPPRFVEELKKFANGAEQADDITMMALKFNGGQKTKQLTVAATHKNLDILLKFVNDELDAIACDNKQKSIIDIAVEEVFSNIAEYAYKDTIGDVTLSLQVAKDPKTFIMTFTDEGVPYNPLTKHDPDITLSPEKRDIGGLGLHIVKKSMDRISYRWENNKNMFTVEKIIKKA